MPRPRIRPEDRQRAVKACMPCKTSKKRCDSKIPCATCIRRNCPVACLYHEGQQHNGSSVCASPKNSSCVDMEIIMAESVQRGSMNSRSYPQGELHVSHQLPIINAAENEASVDSHQLDDDTEYDMPIDEYTTDDQPVEVNSLPRSRLMLNAKGEKVYVGNAASLAFLQFLRQILSQHMGPSHFTENKRGNIMLEAQTPEDDVIEFEEDIKEKKRLIENYFLASSGILHLYTRSEMEALFIGVESTGEEDRPARSLVYLVLAIGGQCCVSNAHNRQHSQKYFTRGQRIAFEGMLEDPSIKLIHSFLLMAFYLLGACRRNAAFMYLGVAARAAHALGLHEADQYRTLDSTEQSLRLKTWKSLRILDIMTSSILARPSASTSMLPDVYINVIEIRDQSLSGMAMSANFEICSIIDDVLQHANQQAQLDAASTQDVLQRLSHWSNNLAPEIRLCSTKASIGSSEHEQVVGSIHIACLYYFTVMLLTRPFLIRYLMAQLPHLPGTLKSSDNPDPCKLAQVSIDAAMFMAQVCSNALSVGLLLDNMCMLKAWIFAAGLVLGFTLFANVEVSPDMESAFTGVRDVLKKLSYQSPQAEHYHDVLSSFAEAITKRREQIVQERRRATRQYLDQILVMQFQDTQDQQCITPASGDADLTGLDAVDIEEWWNLEFPSAPGILDNAPDVLTANWDAFALQISEHFSLNADVSTRMFDEI